MFGPKLDHEIESCEFLVIHPEKDETKSFKKGPLIIFKKKLIPSSKGHRKCPFFRFCQKIGQNGVFWTFFGHPEEEKNIQKPSTIRIKDPGTLFSSNYAP